MSLSSGTLRHAFTLFVFVLLSVQLAEAQRRRPPDVGRLAVVGDERLSALRAEPSLTARLLQRVSRGRLVSIVGSRRSTDGVTFYRVLVTRRTRGWIQSEAVFSATQPNDDDRLFRLIQSSDEFDKIQRARIFLDMFARSRLRPEVLLLFGDTAEAAASQLSRDANRRLIEREMTANGAPAHSYFMNYNGLDRYNRLGAMFRFDQQTKTFHYEGASWREILRRYPESAEAQEARKRIENSRPTGQ